MEPEKELSSSSQKPLSLLGLLGTLVVVSSFVVSFLSKFRAPIQQTVDPNNPARNPNNQQENGPEKHVRIVAVEPYPPPTPTDADKTYRNRKEFREWGILVIELLGLFGLIFYACVNFRMWKEMQEQTRIQRDAYVNGQRAWIIADIPTRIGSFSFDKEGRAYLKATIVLGNIGHSPAVGIETNFAIIFPKDKEVFSLPIQKQKELCEPLRKGKENPSEMPGITILFPSQKTIPLGFSLGAEKAAVELGAFTFSDSPDKYIKPILVGCVDYRFSFAPKEHHQTGFIYDIGRYSSNPAWPSRAIPIGHDLPEGELILTQYFFGGHYAD